MTAKRVCAGCGAETTGELVLGLCEVCTLKSATHKAETRADALSPDAAENRRFGDYMLGRQIGRGGMGVVYEATQGRPHRTVALKMILDSAVDSVASRSRFAIEAETAARLEHPNIVPIYEVGEAEGRPFITMQRIMGENLRHKIASGELCLAKSAGLRRAEQRQLAGTIAGLVEKVARAVHHAHLHGVVHRDLKPANILVDEQGQPHLTDFGLAKRFGEGMNPSTLALTGSGVLLGTPGYMSPEQADARPVTPASDVYSLGAILFEMLTGEPPFRAATLRETLRLVVEQEPSAPSSRCRGIDPDLDTICLKCLEKKPDARYATAEALAVDLRRWIDGQPIEARRAGYAGRTARWVRRNPIGASLIASLSLCLLVSLVLLEGRLRKARQVADEHVWVRERIAQHIDRSWDDASTTSMSIEPRDLAALGDRTFNAGTHAVNLSYAVSIPFDPLTAATKYSRFLGELEKRASRVLGRPVTFSLLLYKIDRWDYQARREADLQEVSFLTYGQLKEAGLPTEAVAMEIQAGDPYLEDAVVFTRADTGITNISQLLGHKVLFAHTNSIVSALGKVTLAKKGFCAGSFQDCRDLEFTPRMTRMGKRENAGGLEFEASIHREVIAQVIRRQFDAGVVPFKVYKRDATPQTNFVELLRFKKTPDLFIARPGLSQEVISALRQSLLNIRDKELLGSTQPSMQNGFGPVDAAEFEEFRKQLRRYLPWFETCGNEASGTNGPAPRRPARDESRTLK